jgi:hypothetical protein
MPPPICVCVYVKLGFAEVKEIGIFVRGLVVNKENGGIFLPGLKIAI